MNQRRRVLDSEGKPIIWIICPQSLEEIKGVEVLGSASINLNNEVCKSASAVHHSETSLVVCFGDVSVR